MKICFWGDIYNSLVGKTKGGGELQISLLAKGLADLGHEVIVIDFFINDDAKYQNIEILSIKKRSTNPIVRYIVFYNLLVSQNADYYYARIRSGIHFIAYLAAKKNRKKFVIGMAHDLDTLKFIDRYKNYYSKITINKFIKKILHCEILYNYVLRKSDFVIAQHEIQKKNLMNLGLSSQVCNNIFSGEILKNIEIKNDNSPFIFLGSLDKRKGIDDIVKIIEELPNQKFVIVGRCRDNYSESKIAEIEEKPNVDYKGQLNHQEVFSLIKKGKALISTSLLEGFPNTFLEAWATGIPVLSLNVDPGGVFSNSYLGKCYLGNITKMINDINNLNSTNCNSEKITDYVTTNHSYKTIITRFKNVLEGK